MIVKTAGMGNIEITEKDVIAFSEGIMGFENVKEYTLIEKEDSPFKWLQAVDNDLSFIIMDPLEINSNYKLMISSTDVENLKAKDKGELKSYVIITIPEDPKKMTANFQGPLVINFQEKTAKQAISLNNSHGVRHNVLDEMSKSRAS